MVSHTEMFGNVWVRLESVIMIKGSAVLKLIQQTILNIMKWLQPFEMFINFSFDRKRSKWI